VTGGQRQVYVNAERVRPGGGLPPCASGAIKAARFFLHGPREMPKMLRSRSGWGQPPETAKVLAVCELDYLCYMSSEALHCL
jgi:hypothetical protein